MSVPTPDQWRRVETLFPALAGLPAEARAEVLDRELPDDPELRALLERMLTHAAAAGAIARAVEGSAAAFVEATAIGSRFGPYEVVREVGRGGMGVVFEAVRADDEYRKRVALKVATGWRGDVGAAERLRVERQILAGLEHDNIARLLDGGTEQGTPYFAMEFVDGEPITAYCARVEAPIPDRLALFRQVCAGVAFAHDHLVAHRDLKPSNILVTAQGVPKLVDFGIAKVLTPLAAAGGTQTLGQAWTPDYVSPEQVRGQAVTPRTDVYALGLVLHELLCGERAQQADVSSLLALDRSVCEAVPAPPSARLLARGARAAARQVAGDLDTIVLTAIAKNPADRYASAAALSDDIGRYLARRPILARPAGALHRVRKFVSRHRAAVGTALLVAAVGLAGLASTLLQARRTARRFQEVRSLAHVFVFDVHDRVAALPGSTEVRRMIVATALSYLESLRTDVGDDPGLARELADAYDRVGSAQGLPVQANLGDTAGAVQSYQRAIALLRPLADRGDDEARRQLAGTMLHLAVVQRARGDTATALASLGEAAALARDQVTRHPDEARAFALAGEIASARARIAFELRDMATVEASSREATAHSERLLALGPGNRVYEDGAATAQNVVGTLALGMGQPAQAAARFRQVVAIRERLADAEPLNAEFRHNLAISYGNLADALAARQGDNLGDTDGAVAALERAAALAEQSRAEDPKDRRALYDLVNVLVRLGSVLTEAEPPRVEAALRALRRAEALTRELLAPDPGVATYRYLDMVVARRLGDALAIAGRAADAMVMLERSRAIGPSLLGGPNGPAVRAVMTQVTARLAVLRAASGSVAAGRREADAAAAEVAKATLGGPLVDALVHEQLGQAYLTVAGPAGGEAKAAALAREHLTASARLWKAARLAGPLEPRRTAALARLDHALARLVPGRR